MREGGIALSEEPGWGALAVVLAGTFVTLLDFFIVNVAVPEIAVDLSAGPSAVSLVVAGYGLTFAAGLITGGRLGDVYGHRRLFRVGLALFTLSSAACGLAPTVSVLVAARLAQGASAAMLSPQVLAILGTVYRDDRRARAFAAYGFAVGIAGVLGQLFGGLLIAADVAGLGWRSIFLVNVPIGILALAMVGRVVPESHGPRARLDLVGAALGALAVSALVLPLVEGREHNWLTWTWVSLGLTPVLVAGFIASQHRRHAAASTPLVDLRLFATRSFAAGSLTALFYGLVPPSFFLVLAIYLQQGRGCSALFSGVLFVAVGVGYFVAMLLTGFIASRLGSRVLVLGAGLTAIGSLVIAATAHVDNLVGLTPGLAVVGFGIGLVLVPLASTVLAGIEPHQAGAAAGVLSTAQQAGGAIGVAVVGVVFFGVGGIVAAFTVATAFIAVLGVLTCLPAALLPLRGGDGHP